MWRTTFFYLTGFPFTVLCLVVTAVAGLFPGTRGFMLWVGHKLWAPVYLVTGGVDLHSSGHTAELNPDQPYVFVSNHQSYFDIPATLRTLKRTVQFVAKREFLFFPLFGFYLWRVGSVIVDRSNRAKAHKTMAKAVGRVRKDTSVLVYAEGTRSPDGEVAAFKRGAFVLALQAQVPVVPVTVYGSYQVQSKHTFKVRSGPIYVHVDRPISTDGLTLDDRAEISDRVRQVIVDRFEALRREHEGLGAEGHRGIGAEGQRGSGA
jgi:1-acyl-sn-glycerol-3-phosphate acyltransferase